MCMDIGGASLEACVISACDRYQLPRGSPLVRELGSSTSTVPLAQKRDWHRANDMGVSESRKSITMRTVMVFYLFSKNNRLHV